MEEELIAKNNKNRESAESNDTNSTDTSGEERPEMPELMDEMGGGPMGGGGFPGETVMVQNDTNEWLAPMVGAGITSGVVIVAAVAIGWMIMRVDKHLKELLKK